jgi:hypothetical protein
MNRKMRAGIAGFCLCASAGLVAFAQASQSPGLPLLTEEEAVFLRLADDARVLPAALRGAGPRIELQAPATKRDASGQEIAETGEDAELVASFAKKEDVDMSKFEVEIRNGDRVLSLTDRLRPYLSENRLDARHLRIPPGRFEIAIRIEDKKERLAERSYLWVVKD